MLVQARVDVVFCLSALPLCDEIMVCRLFCTTKQAENKCLFETQQAYTTCVKQWQACRSAVGLNIEKQSGHHPQF